MAAISKAKDMRIGTVGSVLFEAMELVGAGTTTLTYVLSSFLLTPSNKHGTNSDDHHQIPPLLGNERKKVFFFKKREKI